jgi:hypothetical protein
MANVYGSGPYAHPASQNADECLAAQTWQSVLDEQFQRLRIAEEEGKRHAARLTCLRCKSR